MGAEGRGRYGIDLTFFCTEPGCTRSCKPNVYSRLTRLGGTRLSVWEGPGWYVDGGTVHCPEHITRVEQERVCSETWEEIDLHHAANTLDIAIRKERSVDERWVIAP